MMTARDALNRGFNLLGVAIVSLAGFAFLPEVFLENDIPDKIDDGALFLLGLLGIVWYLRGTHRFSRSIMPVVLVGAALLVKIGALFIEFDDAASVGDDFGALILFVLSFFFVLYQYGKTKNLADAASASPS